MKILYYAGWTATRVISTLLFRIRVTGREHFPRQGGFILATNHVSYFDPLLAGSWSPREVYFFAKQELFKNPLLGAVIRRTNALPVQRGTIDRQALELAQDVISRGYGLTIFPEGTRSRTDRFLHPKPGVGLLSVRAGCPIVPGYLHGSNRLKDCLLGRDRLSVSFGEPFSAEWVESAGKERDGYQRIAEAVMGRIGELKVRVIGAQGRQKSA